jgi:plasmid stabilization system protein ParE
MAHRLAPQERAELSNIWNYIVKESGNAAAADGVIDAITERFYLLSQYPRMGRSRDDLRPSDSTPACLSVMQALHEGLADSKYRPCELLTQRHAKC